MRRATFVFASVVAAAVLAGALLYDPDSLLPPAATQPGPIKATQPQEPPSARTEGKTSDSGGNEEAAAQDQPPGSSVNDQIRRQRAPEPDEATLRADIRKQATRDIRDSYSLLLEDLDISPRAKEGLQALLIDMQVESTWSGARTYEIRGREISQRERYERIAAVIGDENLPRFLALEENAFEYAETQRISGLLARRDAPLTHAQRDGLFRILVEVRSESPLQPPLDSIENLERIVRHLDDYQRHVTELAPSVLSGSQVAYVFEIFQNRSRLRADDLERQKQWIADHPGERPHLYFRGVE
jgi:hypothetical protein